MTVYVVAFESEGSDWYPQLADAEKAFAQEKKNVVDFKDEQWRAAMFPYETLSVSVEKITREIDRALWETSLFDQASQFCGPKRATA